MSLYVTLEEVADELGLSPVDVYWLIRSGKLVGVYRAAEPHWLVRRDELAAYMDQQSD